MMTDKNETEVSVALGEVWWDGVRKEPFVAPDGVPILAPYEKVRPGFEALEAKAIDPGVEYRELGDGHIELCLWDIFFQGDDDPAERDEIMLKINEMQRALGEITEDDRYIRIQIACLVRCFWTFPKNVDLVIKGIGSGKVNLDEHMACEPPWNDCILPTLRRRQKHPNAGTDITDSRQALVRIYMEVLTRWSAFADIDSLKMEFPEQSELAETIYRRLGPPDKAKLLRVERLRFSLGHCAFPVFDHHAAWSIWMELKAVFDAAIQKELGGLQDETEGANHNLVESGLCHHAFFRHIDNIIAHIGKGSWTRLPGSGDEGRRVRSATTNYVHALGSWLANRSEDEAVRIWPDSKDVVVLVYRCLGSQSPRKKWLVASAWKHLQDSQRHWGHGALSDDPERFAIPETALGIQANGG